MIDVYFEKEGFASAKKVATFYDDDDYVRMFTALLKLAKKQGYDKVTEADV